MERLEVSFWGEGKTEVLAKGPLVFLQELWWISPSVLALAQVWEHGSAPLTPYGFGETQSVPLHS